MLPKVSTQCEQTTLISTTTNNRNIKNKISSIFNSPKIFFTLFDPKHRQNILNLNLNLMALMCSNFNKKKNINNLNNHKINGDGNVETFRTYFLLLLFCWYVPLNLNIWCLECEIDIVITSSLFDSIKNKFWLKKPIKSS
jgi:hypothetical protein